MKFLILLFSSLVAISSYADLGDAWAIGRDSAESLIRTVEQVATLHEDDHGQQNLTLAHIFCLAGFDGEGESYSCSILLKSGQKATFSGRVAQTLFTQLKKSGTRGTQQVEGLSIELKDVHCSVIIKNHGTGDYLSSKCDGKEVNVRY